MLKCDEQILSALARRLELVDDATRCKLSRDEILDPALPRGLFLRLEKQARECRVPLYLVRSIYAVISEAVVARQLEMFELQSSTNYLANSMEEKR